MEQISLYLKSVCCCHAVASFAYVCVYSALLGKVVLVRAVDIELIGICKSLHDENYVRHINCAVAVCVALKSYLCIRLDC